MSTPMPWPTVLDYASKYSWCEQPERDGLPDSRLRLLLVDVIVLRENDAHMGVDMVRKDRCALLMIHWAFYNNE
ncbi:hypothetical protein TNCV_8881 [Trichonephila clavipes]|nr:hypothetical protein TNCV_8881 [Trichonephila clavipes]